MRKIILPVLLLLSCATFAGANCRVIEYPDHFEAVCNEDAKHTPASFQNNEAVQIPGQEQTIAADQISEAEPPGVPPEMIVRNELGRLHAASWLKSRQGQ